MATTRHGADEREEKRRIDRLRIARSVAAGALNKLLAHEAAWRIDTA